MQIYYGSKNQALERLKQRNESAGEEIATAAKQIVRSVREEGDAALFACTRRFDGYEMTAENLLVTSEEIEEAYRQISPKLIGVMQKSATNIRRYHERQVRESWTMVDNGAVVGQLIRPIQRAGLYVPGGQAAYPSSVLMNLIPAKVAGVPFVAVATPAGRDGKVNPVTLAAADLAGADCIYRMGGAQAIAALAYGTQSVARVDKITGPGNAFVAAAKREVFGQVGIDMIAGPSEVLVLADGTADPRYLAADLLSQAEHDARAACVLVTTDADLAVKTNYEVERQLGKLSRADVARKSIEAYGAILVAADLAEAIEIANEIAPEHLELVLSKPYDIIEQIKAAGAIFIGAYSPEPLGDYLAGTNHVLPTNGTARFSSALSVDDFILKTSLIDYSREAFRQVYRQVSAFADAEGLTAHAASARIRFEDGGEG